VSVLDRNRFANFDEPRQQLAIQPGETSLTSGKTWKSSVNLPRSNLEMVCVPTGLNAAIAFWKSAPLHFDDRRRIGSKSIFPDWFDS
jgi:hypothetical protein